MDKWPLQHEKARFSELVNFCLKTGPQMVTRNGREVAVLISVEDYQRTLSPKTSLKEFFLSAPRTELTIHRSQDTGRKITL
jgi:prevent-host-death family protein